MNILIVQRFDLSSVSCARRVICQARELLARGHRVAVADFVHEARRRELPAVANLSETGAEIVPLERTPAALPRNLRRLSNLSFKPDIVHLWKSYPDASLPALRLARRLGVPLHYDWDDWEKGIARELANSRLAGWAAGLWDRLMPRLADTMTAASRFLREKTLEYGFPEDRLFDAPVGADLDAFYPRPRDEELFRSLELREPVLIYIGQLEVASYAELAVETLKRVRREFHAATLLIAGGGRKLEAVRERARSLGVERHTRFTNYVPASDIPRYLSVADAALAPFEDNDVTRAKSPLKIAEYLAMGLPVTASDVGDVRTMITGAGAWAPCGDPNAMAEKTLWILKNPGVRNSMSLAGVKRARDIYNWKAHTDALERAYETALALQGPSKGQSSNGLQ